MSVINTNTFAEQTSITLSSTAALPNRSPPQFGTQDRHTLDDAAGLAVVRAWAQDRLSALNNVVNAVSFTKPRTASSRRLTPSAVWVSWRCCLKNDQVRVGSHSVQPRMPNSRSHSRHGVQVQLGFLRTTTFAVIDASGSTFIAGSWTTSLTSMPSPGVADDPTGAVAGRHFYCNQQIALDRARLRPCSRLNFTNDQLTTTKEGRFGD